MTKPNLPSGGGSYVRGKDGKLTRQNAEPEPVEAEADTKARPTKPEPAKSPAPDNKEA